MIRRSFLNWVRNWMRDAGLRTRGQSRRSRRPGWTPQVVQLESRALMSATTSDPAAAGDSFEVDDTAAAATVIATNGAPQTHSFHTPTDVDWVTFTLQTPSFVQIQTGGDLGGDTLLDLYDSNNLNTPLVSDDDGGFDLYSQILRRGPSALPAGTYQLRVSNVDPDNTLANYTVSVLATDIYETDKLATQATPIDVLGTPQAHSLHSRSDVDWVKFTLIQPSFVTIETDGVAGGDTTLDLYGSTSANSLIASDNDSGVDAYSKIERNGTEALAAGTYYVRIRENGQDSPISRYNIRVLATDVYEANNTAAQAKPIPTNGTVQQHSFHTSTDVDWLTFTIDVPSNVVIQTAGGTGGGDTMLDLYGPNSTTALLQSNDTFGTNPFARIERNGAMALQPGTYYVKVSESFQNNTLAQYSISVLATDLFEEDNTRFQAKPVPTDGTPQAHSLHQGTDEDWVSFTLTQPGAVVIRTDGVDGGDTVLELHQLFSLAPLATADGGGTGLYSRIATNLQAGVYYVRVTENGRNNSLSRYTIRVTTDVYEVDNTVTQFRSITTDGSPQIRSLHQQTDVDWVQFSVNQSSIVTITTDGDAGGDTLVELFSSSNTNTPIGSNDNNGVNGYSTLERGRNNPLAAGTYFVRVTENGQNAPIDRYTLRVRSTDQFEQDNVASQAAPIPTDGTPQTHSFHEGSDVDWVTFTLNYASNVTIETNGDAGGDTVMSLYAANDLVNPIQTNDNNGTNGYSRIVRSRGTALPAGTYFVKVSENGQNNPLARYTISVNATDTYEVDNQAWQATLIPTDGSTQEHSFHVGADADWVTFTLGVRSNVTITTAGDEGGDTIVDLYGGSAIVPTFIQTNNDHTAGSGYSRLERSGVNSLPAGTYFVRVTENGQNNPLARYTISVEAKDLFEEDNDAANAKTIPTNGTVQEHSFHTGTDVDWVTFTLNYASNVTIETNGVLAGDTVLALYSANDLVNAIDTNDNNGLNGYSRITRAGATALPAGVYFVKVSESGQNNTLFRYSISVRATDTYEDDNLATQAKPIVTNGTLQEHSFHAGNDADWVSFTLSVRSNVLIQTAGNAGGDTIIDLYGPNSSTTLVQSNNDYTPGSLYSQIERRGAAALPAGTYYVRITENGQNNTLDRYTISVNATDVFEEDNSAAQARTIRVDGTVQEHSFHAGSDADWVTFTLGVPSSVTIRTAGATGGDTLLDLYRGPATSLTFVDSNDDFVGGGGYSQIDRRGESVLPAGIYFIRVTDKGQDSTLPYYTISVTAKDLSEEDNTAAQAKPIATDGTLYERSFHSGSDVDWVTFSLATTSHVTIQTGGVAGGDTILDLYGPNSSTTLVETNDDYMGLYSRISRQGANALPAGIYYVRVSECWNNPLSRYTISVNATDVFEDDNSAIRATSIQTNGTIQEHSFHAGSDSDWVTFSLAVPSNVTILTAGGAGGDTILDLYSGPADSLSPIATNDNYLTGSGYSRLELFGSNVLPAGTYYVRIMENGQNSTLTRYTISVNATDAFENDNFSSQANPIATDGSFQEHSFHAESDVDWVTFTLAVPSSVSIVTNGGAGGDTKLDLFGPNSTSSRIAWNDDDGLTRYSRITRDRSNPLPVGTYYLRITGRNGGSGLSRYTVSVLATDTYEDDNVAVRATAIATNNVAQSHSFHTRADVDWYKFTLTTTATVNFATSGAAGTGTSLELYDTTASNRIDGANYVGPTNTYATLSRQLGPGTYYVRLTEAGMDAVLGLYTMRIWLS